MWVQALARKPGPTARKVSRSQGLNVSRSQGLRVTGVRGLTGVTEGDGVTGMTRMKVSLICEAVEVILRVQ